MSGLASKFGGMSPEISEGFNLSGSSQIGKTGACTNASTSMYCTKYVFSLGATAVIRPPPPLSVVSFSLALLLLFFTQSHCTFASASVVARLVSFSLSLLYSSPHVILSWGQLLPPFLSWTTSTRNFPSS